MPTTTEILYTMPEESEAHEGTWLQWPHQYQYGVAYRNSLDPTWVSMTKALVTSEKVHIIAYNQIGKRQNYFFVEYCKCSFDKHRF